MSALFLLLTLFAAGPARAASGEDAALERLRSPDWAVRESACVELARAPEHGPRVYPALSAAMDRDLAERVRLAAAKAVISFPGDDAVKRARGFLQSEPGPQTRVDLTVALSVEPAHLYDPAVTEMISSAMVDDPSPEARRAAATSLARRGDRRALPALRRAAENDADKAVRDSARQAIRVLSAPPPPRPKSVPHKPKPPKTDAVKGIDTCTDPWGWCECNGPIKRPAKCLTRSECRIEVDTALQLGMPCTWNGLFYDSPN